MFVGLLQDRRPCCDLWWWLLCGAYGTPLYVHYLLLISPVGLDGQEGCLHATRAILTLLQLCSTSVDSQTVGRPCDDGKLHFGGILVLLTAYIAL